MGAGGKGLRQPPPLPPHSSHPRELKSERGPPATPQRHSLLGAGAGEQRCFPAASGEQTVQCRAATTPALAASTAAVPSTARPAACAPAPPPTPRQEPVLAGLGQRRAWWWRAAQVERWAVRPGIAHAAALRAALRAAHSAAAQDGRKALAAPAGPRPHGKPSTPHKSGRALRHTAPCSAALVPLLASTAACPLPAPGPPCPGRPSAQVGDAAGAATWCPLHPVTAAGLRGQPPAGSQAGMDARLHATWPRGSPAGQWHRAAREHAGGAAVEPTQRPRCAVVCHRLRWAPTLPYHSECALL